MMEELTKQQIQQISIDQLQSSQFLNSFREMVDYMVWYSDHKKARVLLKTFDVLLQEVKGRERVTLRERYQAEVGRLHGLVFSFLPDDQAIDFTRTELADGLLDPEILLLDNFRNKVADFPIDQRDEYKQKLLNSININEQLLTTSKIPKSDNSEQMSGSIENWTKHYASVVGTGPASNLDKAKYFSKLRDMKELPEKEMNAVKKLVEIIEYLKRSSLTPGGFEEVVGVREEDGTEKILVDGIVEILKVNPSASSVKTNQDVSQVFEESTEQTEIVQPSPVQADLAEHVRLAFQGDARFEKKVAKEYVKADKKLADVVQVQEEFFKSVQANKPERTVALLRLLAQRNQLIAFIGKDEKLHKFLVATWAQQYGKEFAKEFHQHPEELRFVRQFLRYVLEERLKMQAQDAAREGMKIAGIFVKAGNNQYNKMVYFDSTSEQFAWFE